MLPPVCAGADAMAAPPGAIAAGASFGVALGAGPTGALAAEAVTNGRLSPPANTVTLLSGSIRTAISAPTRLRRSARMRPAIRLQPEMPTSAFGALATTAPSRSRTTMSRMRNLICPLASRSSWVPPISMSWPPPNFSWIAVVSHGVATSRPTGPLASRSQRATVPSRATPASAPTTRANLRSGGDRKSGCSPE